MGDLYPINCRLAPEILVFMSVLPNNPEILTNVLRNKNRVAQVAILATFLR